MNKGLVRAVVATLLIALVPALQSQWDMAGMALAGGGAAVARMWWANVSAERSRRRLTGAESSGTTPSGSTLPGTASPHAASPPVDPRVAPPQDPDLR